jgi:FtsH-binding integral membrane protein
MLQVYDYMAGGLALTGVFAYLVEHSGFHAAMMEEVPVLLPFLWIMLLAPLALAMLFWLDIDQISLFGVEAIFWGYAAYAGFSLGCISLVNTATSIAPGCFIAAATFAAMSVYGYATRTDVSKPGNLLAMVSSARSSPVSSRFTWLRRRCNCCSVGCACSRLSA